MSSLPLWQQKIPTTTRIPTILPPLTPLPTIYGVNVNLPFADDPRAFTMTPFIKILMPFRSRKPQWS